MEEMRNVKISYEKELADKHALVIGSGLSGIGASHLLLRIGASVTLLEQNEAVTEQEIRERLHGEDRAQVRIIVGALSDEEIMRADVVVPSPGVALDTPLMTLIAARSKRIISEVELAYLCMKGRLVAITGTNGKTTTTTLTGELMRAFYDDVRVVGNIGEPFTEHALETTPETLTVAEISSFQLEAVDRFHADVSALLNLTPDHLDRHHTFENYRKAKERITNRQTGDDVCVLNYMDPYTREYGTNACPARVIWFSSGEKPPYGFWFDGSGIRFVGINREREDEVIGFDECRLKGRVGAENIMAALAIVTGMGFDFTDVLDRVRAFAPVRHRIEFIAEKRGVSYYNDSKATNPDAAIHGIEAMSAPTILIGGGYDKQADYDAWCRMFEGRVKELVLIGQTKDAIEKSARRAGFTNIRKEETFEAAMDYCKDHARSGDAVLLSPACASWGMFRNYEERGDAFRAYVEGIDE